MIFVSSSTTQFVSPGRVWSYPGLGIVVNNTLGDCGGQERGLTAASLCLTFGRQPVAGPSGPALYSLTAGPGWCWRRGRRLKSSRLCELCWETLPSAVSSDGGAAACPDCGEISQLDVSTPPVTTHGSAAGDTRAQLVINMFPGVTISPYLQLSAAQLAIHLA